MREDLLFVIYSSKSSHAARLGTPQRIRASAGFTIAALFPNKELNVHVNSAVQPPAVPAVRAPAVVHPPLATNSAASARSAVISPRLGRTYLSKAPFIPGLAVPARNRIDVALYANTRLESDFAKNQPPNFAMNTDGDMDVDVDLGLDMDLDVIPEEQKSCISPSPPREIANVEPVSTRLPTEPVVRVPLPSVPTPATTVPDAPPPAIQPPVVRAFTTVTSEKSNEPPKEVTIPVEAVAPKHICRGTGSTEPVPSRGQLDEQEASGDIPVDTSTIFAGQDGALPHVPPEIPVVQPAPRAVEPTDDSTAIQSAPLAAPGEDHAQDRPMPAAFEPDSAAQAAEQPVHIDWEGSPNASVPESAVVEDMQIDADEVQVETFPEPQHRENFQPALPASPPPPSPPPSALLPRSPVHRQISTAATSPLRDIAPRVTSSPIEILPSPPSHPPRPLPQSSAVRAISPPVSDTLPIDKDASPSAVSSGFPYSKKYPPVPDNDLPVDPLVPRGGGRLEVEVVIDQAEFGDSVEGYFKRLSADVDPEDLYPVDILAAYGFTEYYKDHLLNKRCCITSQVAKVELKQMVHEGGGTVIPLGSEPFDVIIVSNDLFPKLVQADAEGELGFSLGAREVWSFGPRDDLTAMEWKLKRHVPKRSGMVSFCPQAIIKTPDLFLDCLRKIHGLPNWTAFLSAAALRAIHLYIRHPHTPRTLRLKMLMTMTEALGMFQLKYPHNTHAEDRLFRAKQQQIIRRTAFSQKFGDLASEIMKHEELIITGDLCSSLPAEKMPGSERKYWERDAEILQELQEHHEQIDQIYVVKRSIYAGFEHSSIRKGLGDDAIAELGFPAVEGYRLDDLLRDLTRDVKFAGLLLPSEPAPRGREDE